MEKIGNLTTEQKISLLSGADYWRTRDFPDAEISAVTFSDGPAGLRKQGGGDILGRKRSVPATCFPAHSALAQSWNRALVREVGKAVGEEAAACGVDVVLAPALNVKRNPLCGRNFEYFSEDGFVCGKLGAEFALGLKEGGAAACVKHFAANNRERARMVCDSAVDERTLRERYLLPFEIAVAEGQPAAVMTAYNSLNGVPCNQNPALIRDILRGEWGFGGAVISDWGGTRDRVEAVKAGADLEMPRCPLSDEQLKASLDGGKLSKDDIDACARNVVGLSEAVGRRYAPCDYTAHAALARRAAEESLVLLKNDGVLPLRKGKKFALIGKYAENPVIQGGGSSAVNALGGGGLCREFVGDGDYIGCASGGARALRLAKKADIVVFFLARERETEGADESDLFLPAKQLALLEKVCSVCKNVVAVTCCGAAVDTSFDSRVRALIWCGFAGQGIAPALKAVLKGEISPSGKLSETLPYNRQDIPSFSSFGKDIYREEYSEGLSSGYAGIKNAKYSFGFGLSYTKFTYSDLRVGEDGVRLCICNTGDMSGGETVQAYLQFPDGANCPHMRLFGFEKVFLGVGEKAEVFIPFDKYTFRSYDTSRGGFAVVAGEYTLYIGASCDDVRLSATVVKEGVDGVPAPLPPEVGRKYAPTTDKKGRVIADFSTPLYELKNAVGAAGRLIARTILRFTDKKGAAGGTLEYLPLRTACQFAGFSGRQSEGFLQLFNGHAFKGLAKIIFSKRSKDDR